MKKKLFIFSGVFFSALYCHAQLPIYDTYPVYTGADLGLSYSAKQSVFKIWSPPAEQAQLLFYKDGVGGEAIGTYEMMKGGNGLWHVTVRDISEGSFYVFRVKINGKWLNEVPDPYAKAVGVNGKRAVVINLKKTNPERWDMDKSPDFSTGFSTKIAVGNATDAIIYELHVRDASIAANSGIKNKGKFLGLTETGTKNPDGLSTGLDHLKELGVTHIHLLPSYDFYSVDESRTDKPQYNWGYDPLNYNVPEGSYSTNAVDGATRIKEFKKLIQTFHQNGLRVVMDVVYNHTVLTGDSYFNQLVPGYYYRQTKDGKLSNATACGNETASERVMMRKFMLESMLYWVKEYHVDGFRLDLMGVHDIKTLNIISKELHKIKPDILIYGEGWTAGASPLADSLRGLKKYANKLDRIAVFSDDIRDGIKGSVFEHDDKGFASGKPGMEESIKFGIVAACKHPQVNYKKVNYSKVPYAAQPWNTITYCECHDNHVLWDKLAISAKDATENDRKEMHKLALSIVLTSQGISFLHAGTEFLRSKKGVENSFDSPDSINAIDWSLKTKNIDVFKYVQALIKMRKEHPAFRMTNAHQIANLIRFNEKVPAGIICYEIDGKSMSDNWQKIQIIFNGTGKIQSIPLKSKNWHAVIMNNEIAQGENPLVSTDLKPYSCTILFQKKSGIKK